MSFQANDHIQAPASQLAAQTSKDCLKDFSNSVVNLVHPDTSAPPASPGPVDLTCDPPEATSPSPRPQKRARDTTEDAGDDDDTAKLRATKRSITSLVAEVNVPPKTAQELEKRLAQAHEVLAEARTEKGKAENERKVFDEVWKEYEDIAERWRAILDSKKSKELHDQIKGILQDLHIEIVQPLDIYRRAIEEANGFHTEVVRDHDKRLEESASKIHQLEAQVQKLEKQVRRAKMGSKYQEVLQEADQTARTPPGG